MRATARCCVPSSSRHPDLALGLVSIYLVRHAKAGDREKWRGDDQLRPLTKAGREQAQGLADLLGRHPIARILSSPYVRCVQTVEPLAALLRVRVEEDKALSEGTGTGPTRRLIRSLGNVDAVLCTHGDVVQELVEELARSGVVPRSQTDQVAKGSTWVLDTRDGEIVRARYLDAPAD